MDLLWWDGTVSIRYAVEHWEWLALTNTNLLNKLLCTPHLRSFFLGHLVLQLSEKMVFIDHMPQINNHLLDSLVECPLCNSQGLLLSHHILLDHSWAYNTYKSVPKVGMSSMTNNEGWEHTPSYTMTSSSSIPQLSRLPDFSKLFLPSRGLPQDLLMHFHTLWIALKIVYIVHKA